MKVSTKKDQIVSENNKVKIVSKTKNIASPGKVNLAIDSGNTESSLLSDALLLSEKRFRTLYYQSPIAIEHYNKKGNLIDVNPSCLSMFGVNNLADLKNFNLFNDPNLSEEHKKKLRRNEMVKYQGLFDFDQVTMHKLYPTKKTGSIWIDVIITPLKNIKEVIDGYLVQIIDITDRKTAEGAIRESEEKYRELFENVQDVFYKIDLHGKIIEMSPSVNYLSGVNRDELIGHSVVKLYANPKDRNAFLNELMKNGELRDYELKLKSRTGKIIYSSVNARLNYDAKGKPNNITGALRDITKRKVAETMFQDVIEKNPMSIQIIDKNGFTLKVNPAFTKLFGAMPPRDFSVFNDPQLIQSGYTELFEKLKEGEIVYFPDSYYNAHKSVKSIPDIPMYLRVFGFPINYGDHNPEQFVLLHENITKRKLARDELRKSENLFRSVVQNSSDLITLSDENGILRYISPQCEKILGYPAKKLIGVTMPDIIYPEDKLKLQLAREKVFSTGQELHDFIYRIIDSKKKVRWLSHSAKLIMDNGKTLGILSTIRDITSQRLAVDKLRENEEKYRLLFENASQSIAIAQGNFFQLINPKTCELLGYSEEEILSIPISEFIYAEDREMVIGNYRKRLNGKTAPQNYQFRFLTKDKTIKWVELNAVLIKWMGENASLNFLINITKRKKAEDDLKESQAKYQFIVENTNDILWTMNPDFTFDYVSPSVYKFLGYTIEEHFHQRLEEFLAPESVKMITDEFQIGMMNLQKKEFDKLRNSADIEVEFIRKDKTQGFANINLIMIRDENHQIIKIRGITTDITEKNKAEIELQQSNEQLHQLTKYTEEVREMERLAISRELHDDLGQALTAVKIDLVMIKQKISKKEIVQKIEKVSTLVGDTLKSVQRITSNLRPDIIFDLGLDASIELYSNEFAERSGIGVNLNIDTGLFFPANMALNIFRIVQESLTNISRHAKATKVDISLHKISDTVCLIISDNGIGISDDEIKSKQSFGIMSMKERAKSYGGTLNIYRKNKKGTEIKLILPLPKI